MKQSGKAIKRGEKRSSFIFEMHKVLTKAYFNKHFCFLANRIHQY
ncbi:Acetyltransferase, GNAT family [Bacillus mojavensis]|uniref:Acetyltransferase, GNAT family n=1 Tax=Bacillus mojavensis TaxID=72360 RepID=A0ABX6LZD6_BACMO|nr:Acetyltransferase, GNAT family [Bacillus mojavensis]